MTLKSPTSVRLERREPGRLDRVNRRENIYIMVGRRRAVEGAKVKGAIAKINGG